MPRDHNRPHILHCGIYGLFYPIFNGAFCITNRAIIPRKNAPSSCSFDWFVLRYSKHNRWMISTDKLECRNLPQPTTQLGEILCPWENHVICNIYHIMPCPFFHQPGATSDENVIVAVFARAPGCDLQDAQTHENIFIINVELESPTSEGSLSLAGLRLS